VSLGSEVDLNEEIDTKLLASFETVLISKLPHLDPITKKIKNPTPLVNITDTLLECAAVEFGLNISQDYVKVFGKLESPTS